MSSYFHSGTREDGIVLLRMADPSGSTNRTTDQFKLELDALLTAWAARPPTGVIVLSDRPDFGVGGDVDQIAAFAAEGAAAVVADSQRIKALFRRIEQAGFPVVACLRGLAVGGGLELALACHARIGIADRPLRIGLPECTIGLIPGAGGLLRSVHMLGLQRAIDLATSGRLIGGEEALAIGWLDTLVPDEAAAVVEATRRILAEPAPVKPWDRRGYRLSGGGLFADPARYLALQTKSAGFLARDGGRNRAATTAATAACHIAACGFADGGLIESRAFARQALSPEATARIGVALKDKSVLKRAPSRPAGVERAAAPRRVGIIGAGMMGAGIAFANARVGIEVLLADQTLEGAEAGLGRVRHDADRALKRGQIGAAEHSALIARVTPVEGIAALTGCDLLIEAVFEDIGLKKSVMAQLERQVEPGGMVASNTSALSISDIGTALQNPARFIGLHFFSPVDRMHLVEIVRGAQTSDATLAAAWDYAATLGKMQIVVQDSHGFFASRVFQKFIYEAAAMVYEGIPAAIIENAALLAGYPAPPLSLIDDTSLALSVRVIEGAAAANAAKGLPPENHPGEAVIRRLAGQGRTGRSAGAGFYDYDGADGKTLWPGLAAMAPCVVAADVDLLAERYFYAQLADVLRCLSEGVIASAAEVNSGAIRAIGFPAWTGGPLRLIGRIGHAAYLSRAAELTALHGARFDPGLNSVVALEMLLAQAAAFDAADKQ